MGVAGLFGTGLFTCENLTSCVKKYYWCCIEESLPLNFHSLVTLGPSDFCQCRMSRPRSSLLSIWWMCYFPPRYACHLLLKSSFGKRKLQNCLMHQRSSYLATCLSQISPRHLEATGGLIRSSRLILSYWRELIGLSPQPVSFC